MNREEFLKQLIVMFPKTFDNPEHTQAWVNAYKKVIPESLDCQELFDTMIKTYNSTAFAPPPAWINETYCQLLKDKQDQQKFIKPEDIEGVPPPPEFYELKKKLFGSENFKIVKGGKY